MNFSFQLARLKTSKEFGCVVFKFLTSLDISEKCRAGNFDAFG
jgi:hypothetical protein